MLAASIKLSIKVQITKVACNVICVGNDGMCRVLGCTLQFTAGLLYVQGGLQGNGRKLNGGHPAVTSSGTVA